MRPVGGADFHEPSPGGRDQLPHPEPVADLDQLAARHDDLVCERGDGQHQRGGTVVHDERVLGSRHRREQRVEHRAPAGGPGVGGQAELQIGVPGCRHHRRDGGVREGGASEVGVDDDPRGVEHGPH